MILYKAIDPSERLFVSALYDKMNWILSRVPSLPIYLEGNKVGQVLAFRKSDMDSVEVLVHSVIPELDLFNITASVDDDNIATMELVRKEVFNVNGLRVPDIRSTEIRTEIRGR